MIRAKVFERPAKEKKETLRSSPSILCVNGQAAGISVGQSLLTSNQEIMNGITIELTPTIDGKHIHLEGFFRLRKRLDVP